MTDAVVVVGDVEDPRNGGRGSGRIRRDGMVGGMIGRARTFPPGFR